MRRRSRPGDPLVTVANDACLQTVPRTVNTGLGALFILVALYVLGGETLTDFALALLIGIVVGTYSSVFTATPLLVALERQGPRPPGSPPPARRRATRDEVWVAEAAIAWTPEALEATAGAPTRAPSRRPAGRSTAAKRKPNKRKPKRR